METTGRITAVLPKQSGVSQRTGNPWQRQDIVIEFAAGSYYRKVAMTISGENVDRFANLMVVGQTVTAHWDVNAREWNGRWFNEITAWNITADNTAANAAATTVHTDQGAAPFPPEQEQPF